jgi:branched-chain amino acid transport system permease protein
MWDLLNSLLRGLQVGSVYAIVGLGLNVIFAATGVFNFAQGELVMVGGMLGVSLWVADGFPLGVALLLVVIVTSGIGALTEILAIRRLASQRDATLWMLSTLGVAIVVRSTATLLATRTGGEFAQRNFPNYIKAQPWHWGQLLVIPQRAFLIVVAVVLTSVTAVWFRKARWGRGLLALAADREAAAMRGLPVGALAILAFAIGGLIAGLGGFLGGPVTQASTTLGFGLTLNAFIAATIGGIPNLWGPLLGGAVLGIGQELTAQYLDAELQTPISLGILLVVLALRPQGVLGRQVRAL